MITTALIFSMTPALAQTRDSKPPVDPEYEAYLVEIERIHDVIGNGNTDPQIDRGMVSVVSLGGDAVGEIWSQKLIEAFGMRVEHWFFQDDTFLEYPSEGFELTMFNDSVNDPAKVGANLHLGWMMDAYVPVTHAYTDSIPPGAIGLLGGGPAMDRHGFVLLQGGDQVGAMLREVHTVGGVVDKYIEHWVYFHDTPPLYSEFQMLRNNNDSLRVEPDGLVYLSAAGFFAHYAGVNVKAYAMPEYDPFPGLLGSDF